MQCWRGHMKEACNTVETWAARSASRQSSAAGIDRGKARHLQQVGGVQHIPHRVWRHRQVRREQRADNLLRQPARAVRMLFDGPGC
jgi:hypothetical protein